MPSEIHQGVVLRRHGPDPMSNEHTLKTLGRGCLRLVTALALSACGETGDIGPIGEPGERGPAGRDGQDGQSGTRGEQGEDGTSCTVVDNGDGTVTISCEDGTTATVADGTPGMMGMPGMAGDSCTVTDNGNGTATIACDDGTTVTIGESSEFTLQLLHFADVDGNEATALSNVDEFSALVDAFQNDPTFGAHTLTVSSGDNIIPGPRYFAAENDDVRSFTGSNEPGHADHFLMNAFGVQASAIGNHELDQGPGEFADSLQSETRGNAVFPGTTFPYLAANIDFNGEDDLTVSREALNYRSQERSVAASTTVRVGAEIVGIVGASTPELPSITTAGNLEVAGSTTNISELAAAIQPTIGFLSGVGVDKIVLLSHLQQINLEKALAAELRDVDIIVAGGSNTRQGDATDTLYPGDGAFDEDYPFQTTDRDGNPVLIVNVDGDYKYLGRLVVTFDENGILIPNSIDAAVSGTYATTEANVTAVGGTPIPDAVTLRDRIDSVIQTQFNNVVGHTDVFLEGRRGVVRTEETNLGNLTADSMKWYAERCAELTNVIALKNGGGIRAEIGDAVTVGTTTTLNPPFNFGLAMAQPGDVSEGHFRGTLRFDNGLVVVSLNGEELKVLLENGFSRLGPGVTDGRFPQLAGIAVGFDPAGTPQVIEGGTITTAGTRVRDLYVDTDANGNPDTALYIDGVAQAAASNSYELVTLNFLANGGDDYPFDLLSTPNRRQIYTDVGFGDPEDGDGNPDFPILSSCDPGQQSGFSDTGGEQDALAEYFIEFFPDTNTPFTTIETPPADDRRIQDLAVIPDFVVPTN
ncbi:MAG: 5'-nucleotidase C-terminal domain-containing protein [Myxococcota bacterium]